MHGLMADEGSLVEKQMKKSKQQMSTQMAKLLRTVGKESGAMS